MSDFQKQNLYKETGSYLRAKKATRDNIMPVLVSSSFCLYHYTSGPVASLDLLGLFALHLTHHPVVVRKGTTGEMKGERSRHVKPLASFDNVSARTRLILARR